MKYIVIEQKVSDTLSRRIPIIFPNSLTHALVAESMLQSEELTGGKVVSAGTISSLSIDAGCHGESYSCGVKCDVSDDELIHFNDYNAGLL